MKRIIVAAAASLLMMGSASAADLAAQPVEPIAPAYMPYSWTGFYVGVQSGYSFFDNKQNFPGFAGGFEGSPNPDTFTLGGQAGYRYQFNGGVVVGVEGDIYSYFDSKDQAPMNIGPNGMELTAHYGGSVRGQLGYAFNRFLPYVTGGVAVIDYSGGSAATVGAPLAVGSTYSDTTAGWTLGAGLAYAFTDHIVGNVDYRYSDYGSTTFTTPGVAAGKTKVDLKESAIKVGISYKF